MSFILYYDPALDEQVQYFVPPGEPIDQLASTLGIIELSLNEFPGINVSPDSPTPPDWNYDSVNPRSVAMAHGHSSLDENSPG